MIQESGYEEFFTVYEFVDENGNPSTFQDATIVLVKGDNQLVLPFCKKELGDEVKIGDEFVKKTEIIPIDSKIKNRN